MKNNKKLKTILLVGALTANFCLPISAYAGEDRVCPAGLLASELEKIQFNHDFNIRTL